jgi:hypothetical protein
LIKHITLILGDARSIFEEMHKIFGQDWWLGICWQRFTIVLWIGRVNRYFRWKASAIALLTESGMVLDLNVSAFGHKKLKS